MPKINLCDYVATDHTGYPPPHDAAVKGRTYRRIGEALGLTDFGVSEVTLAPGAWSSQRHWHEGEDELVVMLDGEAVLVEDGECLVLKSGDIAVFRKAVPSGHHLINESGQSCRFLAVGRPAASDCHYPDVDMHLDGSTGRFTAKPATR